MQQALTYDIDAVYFGDDWGQQRGLQMGPSTWRTFILPQLRRMYATVRRAGKLVMIHSCGDVDELFDDLVDAGVNCFNPFQPEVMDIWQLLPAYRGRLAFHGGLSTQRTLPFGTVATSAMRHDGCSNWVAMAATFSPRHTMWKATCRWRTCWPPSTPCRHKRMPRDEARLLRWFVRPQRVRMGSVAASQQVDRCAAP